MSKFQEWYLLRNYSFECSVSRFWFFLKLCFGTTHSWVSQVTSTFIKFLLFFVVPVSVELIFLKWIGIQVSLVFTLVVGIFEQMGTWFTLLGFESWRVSFLVCFAAPHELLVMFKFMGLIVLDAFCSLNLTWKCWIFPLLATLVLGNIWVHVGISNNSSIAFYIEVFVN